MPRGKVFPHVEEAKLKDFPTGQSLHLLWLKWQALDDLTTAQAATIQQQADALAAAEARLQATQNTVASITTPSAVSVSPATPGVPPPTPPPVTPPTGVPDLSADVVAVRATYGATMTADECAALLNTVAWNNQAQGWGLYQKPSGNYGLQPHTGTQVSVDNLYHQPSNSLWDCLIDAGHITGGAGTALPDWRYNGTPADPTRWVAPVTP
jgi:hypothetical protein